MVDGPAKKKHILKLIEDLRNPKYEFGKTEINDRLYESGEDGLLYIQLGNFGFWYKKGKDTKGDRVNVKSVYLKDGIIWYKNPRACKTDLTPKEFLNNCTLLAKYYFIRLYPEIFDTGN